jgi:hypothetical protein
MTSMRLVRDPLNPSSVRMLLRDDLCLRPFNEVLDARFIQTSLRQAFADIPTVGGAAFSNNTVLTLKHGHEDGSKTQFRLLPAMNSELLSLELRMFYDHAASSRKIWVLSDSRVDAHHIGFIIAELQQRTPVIHVMFIKEKFRRQGYAVEMLKALNILDAYSLAPRALTLCTFPSSLRYPRIPRRSSMSWCYDWLFIRLGVTYDVFALLWSTTIGRRIHPEWIDEPLEVVTQEDEDKWTSERII